MKYIDFINKYLKPIFTAQDLRIAGIDILPVQMSKWVKKKYLIKLKKGVYAFRARKNELMPETISHYMYEPSYISLERALATYGIIPEMVYNTTAVTVHKTLNIQNELGIFIYRKIKKELFFGYNRMQAGNNFYLIAEPEKALLDYMYLNSAQINNQDDIKELRLNEFNLQVLDMEKFKKYLHIFNSKKLNKIYKLIFV